MNEQFLRDLQETIIHLYDPDQLRRSPLSLRLRSAGLIDASGRLQGILIKAIEGLKPKPGVPSQSRSWRIYDLLNFCYLQQLSQDAAANQLGISARHLRRERQAAIEALVYELLEKYPQEFGTAAVGEYEFVAQPVEGGIPTVSEELSWVKDLLPEVPVDLHQALADAVELICPLAEQYQVRLKTQEIGPLPGISLHPVVLNQLLLDLISILIHSTPSGEVMVSVEQAISGVKIQADGRPCPVDVQAASKEGPPLELLSKLANLCGCWVYPNQEGDRISIAVLLPAAEQLPVLAIDDNADTLQLFSRYTEGTRYRLVGARSFSEALRLVEEFAPQMILLDVMMPREDGWHVLGQLRNHPLTSSIPVVICTILAQEDLALSLGASGFLRKPVTRPDFLAALDHQCEQMARGSRSAA